MNGAMLQASYKPCPECGGQRVVAKFNGVTSRIYTGILSFSETIPIICTNCGYTVYYTSDPEKVRQHYLK